MTRSATIPGVRSSRGYSPRDLQSAVRVFGRPRIAWANAGWLCVIAAGLLSLLGVAAIMTVDPGTATRQIAFLCLGVLAATAATIVPYGALRFFTPPVLAIVIALLIFVLIPSVPESIVRPRNGARRWINLGFTDFQPSELTKLAYIAALAAYLESRRNYRRFFGLFKPLLLTFIPMGLILVEPDLGTSLLFLPVLFAMLLAAGSKLKHLILIIALGLASTPLMYPMLAPHQKQRIQALIFQMRGDDRHQAGIGYQGDKAKMLVGAGQVTGHGAAQGRALVKYNRLPEDHNDMVFAVVCIRWGFLGAIGTLGLSFMLCLGGVLIAAQSNDPFGRLIAVGIATLFFAQMAINIGMTIGLMPITGMTLPFVSYGGSSLVSLWLMIGLLLNIGLRHSQYLSLEAREFDDFSEGA